MPQDITTTQRLAFPARSSAMPATRYPAPHVSTVIMPTEGSASSAQASCHFASTARLEHTAAPVLLVITPLEARRAVFCVVRLRLAAARADLPHTARPANLTTTSAETYARPASLTLHHAVHQSSAIAVSAKVHRCAAHA